MSHNRYYTLGASLQPNHWVGLDYWLDLYGPEVQHPGLHVVVSAAW